MHRKSQTGEFFRFWSTLGLRSPTTADIHQSSAFERLKLHLIVRVPKTAEDLPVSPEVYSAGTGARERARSSCSITS